MRTIVVRKSNFKRYLTFILATVIILFVTHHLMVLLHEWTHGTTAWMFGCKDSPFDIQYGGWTLSNVDENINYKLLFSTEKGFVASMIAVSALLMNALLFILSIILLSRKTIQRKRWFFHFFYWFAVMNIGELFSYIPVRTFVINRGDVGHFTYGLNLSPWVVFVPGIFLVAWGLWYIIKRETPRFYHLMALSSVLWRHIHFIILVFVIFFWFGSSAFYDYGMNSLWSLWSLVSVLMGVVVFIICNPSSEWVKRAVDLYALE